MTVVRTADGGVWWRRQRMVDPVGASLCVSISSVLLDERSAEGWPRNEPENRGGNRGGENRKTAHLFR